MALTTKYKGAGTYSGDGTCTNSSTFKCTVSKWQILASDARYSVHQCQDSCRTVLSEGAIIAIVVFVLVAVFALTIVIVSWCIRRKRRGASATPYVTTPLPPGSSFDADPPPDYTYSSGAHSYHPYSGPA
jgi:hypothetical protein